MSFENPSFDAVETPYNKPEDVKGQKPEEVKEEKQEEVKEKIETRSHWVDVAGDKLMALCDWTPGKKTQEKVPEKVIEEGEPKKKAEYYIPEPKDPVYGFFDWVSRNTGEALVIVAGKALEKGYNTEIRGISPQKIVDGGKEIISQFYNHNTEILGVPPKVIREIMGKKIISPIIEVFKGKRSESVSEQGEREQNLLNAAEKNKAEIKNTEERIESKKGFFGKIKEIFSTTKESLFDKLHVGKKELTITGAQSFKELFKAVDKKGEIQYSTGDIVSAKEIKERINQLKEHFLNHPDVSTSEALASIDFSILTRNEGLRSKVKELIDMEASRVNYKRAKENVYKVAKLVDRRTEAMNKIFQQDESWQEANNALLEAEKARYNQQDLSTHKGRIAAMEASRKYIDTSNVKQQIEKVIRKRPENKTLANAEKKSHQIFKEAINLYEKFRGN